MRQVGDEQRAVGFFDAPDSTPFRPMFDLGPRRSFRELTLDSCPLLDSLPSGSVTSTNLGPTGSTGSIFICMIIDPFHAILTIHIGLAGYVS